MEKIQISEFKALCLRLLEEIHQTGEPLIVTKNGKPLVVVHPFSEPTIRVPFGIAKGTAKIKGDIVEPASSEEEWDVLS